MHLRCLYLSAIRFALTKVAKRQSCEVTRWLAILQLHAFVTPPHENPLYFILLAGLWPHFCYTAPKR